MNRLLCRIFGHRWDYRTVYATGWMVDRCSRCGEQLVSTNIDPEVEKLKRRMNGEGTEL